MSEELKPDEFIDAGKFIDYVWSLRAERDQLRAELASIKAGQGEAVAAWVLNLPDGRSTLEKVFPSWAEGGNGYSIQPLYTSPPSSPGTVPVWRELLERIDRIYSDGMSINPELEELRALLAQHEGVKS